MKIGIDIDDTISNTIEKWINYANEYERKYLKIESKNKNKQLYDSHKWLEELYNWNDENINEFFNKYSDKMLKTVEPKENAAKVIKKISDDGNKIIIITSRHQINGNYNFKKITLEWLKKYGIVYDKIYFNATNSKLRICLDEKIDVFIDDNYNVCKSMMNNNIFALLMESKFNHIDDGNIKRVTNWEEVYKEIINYKKMFHVEH